MRRQKVSTCRAFMGIDVYGMLINVSLYTGDNIFRVDNILVKNTEPSSLLNNDCPNMRNQTEHDVHRCLCVIYHVLAGYLEAYDKIVSVQGNKRKNEHKKRQTHQRKTID